MLLERLFGGFAERAGLGVGLDLAEPVAHELGVERHVGLIIKRCGRDEGLGAADRIFLTGGDGGARVLGMGHAPGLTLAIELLGIATGLEQERLGLTGLFRHRHGGSRPLLEHLDADQLDPEQQRAGILGPGGSDARPGPRYVAAIEVQMNQRIERRGVLEVEQPVASTVQERLEIGLRAGHFVAGQLDHGHVERGQGRGGVQVSAFPSLLVQDGPSPLELVHLTEEQQRPQGEVVPGIALPGHARAMIAEESARPDRARSGRPSSDRKAAS